MARMKGGFLSGVLGPVVSYQLNGKQILRSLPASVKQHKKTVAASEKFGIASMLAARVWNQSNFLQDIKKRESRYGLQNALTQWMKNNNTSASSPATGFYFLEGFQLNDNSSIAEKLRVNVGVSWEEKNKAIVNIPSLIPMNDIAAPPNCDSIQWVFETCVCQLNKPVINVRFLKAEMMDMKYNNKPVDEQEIPIQASFTKGQLILVMMGLKYTVGKSLLKDEKWLPVGIIGSHS